jgi:hypothetical protein
MRRLVYTVLILLTATLTARAQVSAGGSLSPEAAAFKAKFADRRATCQAEAAMRLGISNGDAAKFCDCQIEVFARGLTPEEMRAIELATFGSDEESDASAAAAITATTRLIPERKRVCGH